MAERKTHLEIEEHEIETPDTASEADFSPQEKADSDTRTDQEGAVEEDVEQIRQERDRYYDQLLRKQAEFENYRKRATREKEEARRAGRSELINDILLVLDACEKGLESMDESSDDPILESFRSGYNLLLKQLRVVLERYEVQEVPGVGAKFDPRFHEAVLREKTAEHDEETIIEEYRKGYTIGDRLLRPAQVKVAVPTDEPPKRDDDE